MIGLLRKFFAPGYLRETLKHSPQVKGHVQLEMRERGKLVGHREGFNIWTLTGREYLTELIALQSVNPAREVFRNDRVAYLGVGTGAQPEVSNITSLVEPVPYRAGEFLAGLAAPATFPVTGTDAARTSVQFLREFSRGEISLGFDVVLSEAGLYTDGDPDNDWDITSTPTDYATASGRAPVAYKTFEPITKTTQFTLRVIWEVRFI
jgi:hypothetical protein